MPALQGVARGCAKSRYVPAADLIRWSDATTASRGSGAAPPGSAEREYNSAQATPAEVPNHADWENVGP